jgi:hypothetical protein
MTEKRRWVSRGLVLVSALALLLVAAGPLAARTMLAAPVAVLTLDATQDTYTDINLPSTNMDDGLLTAANSPGPPQAPDVTTKVVYLAFDLSGVAFEIRSARLRLSTLTCGGLVPVDAVDVVVYGVNNGLTWAEDTLTWDTQPVTSTGALASLDAGAITFDSSQTYTWTDDNQGDFASWLETQRGANDGSATLALLIDNADDPGMADIFFEDREGTGAAYGCTDSLGGPTLQVSDLARKVFLPLVRRQ